MPSDILSHAHDKDRCVPASQDFFLKVFEMKKYILISCVVLGIAWYINNGRIQPGKVAQTENGGVQGVILRSRAKQEFYAWHHIPYAQPPLGDLRFADPKPPKNWVGVRDGTKQGPACAQTNPPMFGSGILGDEDCLHVNVFVPKKIFDNKDQIKTHHPVLVYIHGGAYIMGSPDMFGPEYVIDEDIIVVTVAYRLHILGFLTTGDKVARGNQGLKDQTMALKWVQMNIHNFGGNRNQVTIFGASAGGASVHQQMLSPLSKGLFQKAFSLSGAASNSWGMITLERSLEKTQEVANHFKCPSQDTQQLVQCLRKLKVQDLLENENSLWTNYFLTYPQKDGDGFLPIVEAINDSETFLPDHPLKIVAAGKSHHIPWMVGLTTHEGLIGYRGFKVMDPKGLETYAASPEPRIQQLFQTPPKSDKAKKIWDFYFPPSQRNSLTSDQKLARYFDLFGDGFFNFDLREAVRHQRQFSPVYYYLHNKTDNDNWLLRSLVMELDDKKFFYLEVAKALFKSFLYDYLLEIPPPFVGIQHANDGSLYGPIMGLDFFKPGGKNYEYSRDLVRMLAEFMRDDAKMTFRGEHFLPTPSKGPIKAFEFKNDYAEMVAEPFADRMKFLQALGIRPIS